MMKAVIWKGPDTVEYTDVPEPMCIPGWVKIRVMAVGLCVTEAHVIAGTFHAGNPPHILGHEICGDVVELGTGCSPELLGKRVVVETYVGCGKCIYCRTGRKHLCSAGEIGYPPYPGGDAQFVVVPETSIHCIPDQISYDEGGIMEAAACPFGALMSAGFAMGQTILVQGAGVGGLSFIQAARAAGAKKIICTVRNEEKARQAHFFGADIVIDLRTEDLQKRVMEETDSLGVDVSVDAAGVPETIENAIHTTASGGKVILYGIPDEHLKVSIPISEVILRQITLCGYTGNEFAWKPLIAAVSKGSFNLKDMVSQTFPLRDFDKALSLLKNKPKDLIKVVLHPWD